MTYRATIKLNHTGYSKNFNTIAAAENWLDSENNNLQYTTTIEEFDDNFNRTDWFYYTEAQR